jgi:uncharacterized protein YggE
MQRSVFLILVLMVTLVCSPLAGKAAEKDQVTTVELETEGTVQVKPDKATFNFSVVTEAPQAQEAARLNTKEAEIFLTAVKKVLGKDDKVKTVQYQVFPVFRRVEKAQGKSKVMTDEITGYRATNRFQVELRDLEKIGLVADTALKNGANEVQGPYFSHTQQEDLQNQATVKALERARKLAEALAQASGLKVKRVSRMSTTQNIHPRVFAMAKAAPPAGAAEVTTPIEVGDITYQSRLTVTFELAP